ncbi:unnamed protein product [Rhizoctonia solani]|uniref:Protein kinase domain-containing protein n=1 Tax=Rhizoctonia solani TaxID=456999 RepID=A0A8H2X8G9_9AGAM|nr:unnamed protein product [Rhizoctonia solani]
MIPHEGHTEGVNSVIFSPDGKSIVTGSYDATIRTWDAHDLTPVGEPLRGHSNTIESISYSSHSNIIASASGDWTIRLWDANTRRQLGEPVWGDHHLYAVAFSPDAKIMASGCGGFFNSDRVTVQLWDVQKRTAVSRSFKGHTSNVVSIQFSPDGSRLVSGPYDRTVRVWDVERGATFVDPLKGHAHWVRSIALSPDGSRVVSCSDDRTLRLWDVRTGKLVGNPYNGHTHYIYSVDFSPCGPYIVSGGIDKTIRLWDIRTGRQLQQFEEHSSSVSSVAFSPCGQYVASGSIDGKVVVRNILCNHPDSVENTGSRMITRQMSIQQMFDCLIESGCIDFSPQMDTRQDTAMIMSGGGFGDIWKGKLYDGGKVAIKAWRTNTLDHCNHKNLKRAARELFCWSKMQHPNIHQLQGVIIFREQYLGMVSEWMENGNLHEYIRKQPKADRYQLCMHIASGLEYMHSRNTVHGDLKAANVLVSTDGIAMLSDFDFSIMSEVSSLVFSESSNSRSGSLRWAAPEILFADVPKRTTYSDVYALGMVSTLNI